MVATTTQTTPQPSAPAPPVTRVLTVGDGVMFDLEPAVAAAFGATTVTTPRAYFGMGLSRPEQWDWRAGWRDELAAVHPDVVVVLQGVWDARAVTVDSQTYVPGTTDWARWYAGLVNEALDLLTSTGGEVVWVSTLAEASADKADAIAAVNRVAHTVVAGHRAARWLDADAALARTPNTSRPTVGPDGSAVPVRKLDGEHLCAEGAARLASAVRDVARSDFVVSTDDGWRTAAWRHDPRYGTRDGCEG
ncbi:MAG: uncharacterized protein QOD72_2474 [Acidimicrobiaceae bacterium]|nr:uncharacterized protein [Acidimicrobiaceae bacterium]